MSNLSNLTEFFAQHFRGLGADERIEIRSFPKHGGPAHQSWHADAASASRAALALPKTNQVFFGTNARVEAGGKKEHVTKVRVLHADMDFKVYPDGRAGAFAALQAFPLEPTVVVESGGGFHLYWHLSTPLDPSAQIEQLLLRLYVYLGGLDSVQDLSRVMRVPETFNNKTDTPQLVEILHADYEAVYTLADFEALLPAPVEPERVVWSPPADGGGRSAYDDVPSIAEMREILHRIPPGGDYKADWLRILAAVHSVYPGPEGEAMCAEWCDGKPGEIARKFASFKRDGRASDAASVGTLIYTAKQNGYEPPRRAHASAKFTMDATPQPAAADDQVLNVLEMAQELDTVRRENVELKDQLERCAANTQRLTAENAAQRSEIAALEAISKHTDQTIAGAAPDIYDEAMRAYKRGAIQVQEGKEYAQVVHKRASSRRSAQTISKAIDKLRDEHGFDTFDRDEPIETERFKGTVPVDYVYIPPELRAPDRRGAALLYLLPPPGEKKHGGPRRKVDLPEFDEPVAGPVKCVTEKRKLWSDLTTEKVVKVERIDSHTEHFDADGYQMTAAEVDAFNISIGKKVKEPSYRPRVQLPLSPEDIELTKIPRANLDDDPRRPIPLHGSCAWEGCPFPAQKNADNTPKDLPLCSRHTATHGFSMTGAD